MNLCDNCTYAKECSLADAYAGEIIGCPKHKPATNYDRLISKSPEELAEWLAEVLFHCSNTICDKRCPMYSCCCDQPSDNILDWLKQEDDNG